MTASNLTLARQPWSQHSLHFEDILGSRRSLPLPQPLLGGCLVEAEHIVICGNVIMTCIVLNVNVLNGEVKSSNYKTENLQ